MSTKLRVRSAGARYEFIRSHRREYSAQAMCRVLGVARSSSYEWLQHPRRRSSGRARSPSPLLRRVYHSWCVIAA